jgi:trehalose/maltose hydrolase-like predicted phosphorylase
VFWDELFVLPLLTTRFPSLARSLLLYRYRRLDRARRLARRAGHQGAMFPWQSGSDGREETPVRLFNVRSRRWMPDNSQRQRHVSLAIAHNAWRYVQTTGDDEFLVGHGTELLVEIARFWAGLAELDGESGRYDLAGVMGPDEFHDGYPDRPGEGLVNNTYTNVLASWVLCRALDAVRRSTSLGDAGRLWARLRLDAAELAHWDRVSRNLTVEFDPAGRLDQFRGYHTLEEFDWDRYRDEYGDIGRLDLILEAEDDSTNRYQLSKQADALMLFYLFSAEEITEQLAHLGYRFDAACIPDTVHHHLARTSHGSTLSRVAHSWVLARTDRARSWRLFCDALASDVDDTQGGTTGEGIHLGAMAGTVDLLQRCYSGLEIRDDGLRINPRLPDALRRLRFPLTARGHRLELDLRHDRIVVRSRSAPGLPALAVTVRDDRHDLPAGGTISCRPPVTGPGEGDPPLADEEPVGGGRTTPTR